MTAIRKHLVDVVAIIALIIVALIVAGVILANQRLALPGWVPGLGQDFTEVEAELSTAQASRRARARRSTWPAWRSARSPTCGWSRAARS